MKLLNKTLILLFILLDLLFASSSKEYVTVQLNWKYQYEFAGFIAAKEKGFYDDVGLNVHLKEFDKNTDIIQDLKDKKSTFAIYDFSILSLQQQKDNIKFVANYFKRSGLVFVTKQDIVTPFDLKNKIIMAENEQIRLSTLGALLKKFKIAPKDYTLIDHAFNPQLFIDNKIDAMSAYFSNELYQLKKANIPFNIIDPQSYGIYGSGGNVITTKEIIKQNPQLVRKFIEATNKGWNYALNNKQELIDIIYNKYSKQKTKDALLFEAENIDKLIMPSIYEIGKIDKDLLQKNINELISSGLIKNGFNVDDIVFDVDNKKDEKLHFTKQQQEYINKKDKIKMCIDPNWMPYEKLLDGKHIGMTSEYMPMISEKIQIPIQLVKTKNWTQSIDFIKNRKCDILSLASATPSRLEYMKFTSPYINFPLVIATKNDELFIPNPGKIVPKKKIAVVKDYSIGEILKKIYPKNNIIEVDNIEDGMQKVVEGEVYGFVDALPTIAYNLQHKHIGELKISGKFDIDFNLGVGVRDDDQILFELIQKGVDSISEAKKQKILNNYISVNVESSFDYKLFYEIVAILVVISILLLYRHFKLSNYNKKLKKQQIALNSSNKNFQTLLNSISEGILIFENRICIDSNEIAYKMFGYNNKNEIIGKDLKEFVVPKTYEMVLEKTKNNQNTPYECKGIKKDGKIIDLLAKGTNATLNSKKVRISVAVDITETKQKEQVLFQQSKMAAMGQMLENIAHQWRQPLSMISSISTGIQLKKEMGVLDETEEKKDLEKINEVVQHLSLTIDDFRNFFKTDKKIKEFSILQTIEKSFLLVEKIYEINSIKMVYQQKDDVLIKSYENEFAQALMNIFSNAKDALEKIKGDRFVFINLKKDDNFFYIDIKDNANGIDEDILKKIFEPYFTTKHQSQGTGIGLYMTKMIIEKHMDGTIEVANSEYEYKNKTYKGANFTIKLPL